MKFEQVAPLLNSVLKETLGETAVQVEDLQNVVELGKAYEDIINNDAYDKYCNKVINKIGRTIFVDRVYKGQAPSVLMDGWTYGSIMEKLSCEPPESTENASWKLTDGQKYDQDTFHAPDVTSVFFNSKVTYEIKMSFTQLQVEQSFTSASKLAAFFSMIENTIINRKTMDYDNLIMRTINNFTAQTLYTAYGKKLTETDYAKASTNRAVNLLYLYKVINPTSEVTAENCMYNLDFIKFASYTMKRYSKRLEKASKLFNYGNKTRFTPKDRQKFVLLADFADAADVYLQSETFHNEMTKIEGYETVSYWQGSGTNYSFGEISDINVTIKDVFNDAPSATGLNIHCSGILGVVFDRDALGVCNKSDRVPTHYNAAGEFTNFFYKSDAEYFNDYNENFVVFFVCD